MNVGIYAIYDSKAEAFLQPFFSQTTGTAIRAFKQAANTPENNFYEYAEDYTMFHLGDFDDQDGTITAYDAPVSISKALVLRDDNEL